jgi:hypothetical protein
MIMNTITTTLATVAMFSDDGKKRYLLRKLWDEKLPSLAVIMLAPSEASGIELDTTTQLVLNNASRLGYGSVTIVNLFATLNDFKLQQAEDEDAENLKEILLAAKNANQVVYAPGVGKAKNKAFALRQEQVLNALRPYEVKLCCLCNESGDARLQHPLSPAVRVWHLSAFKISELLPNLAKEEHPAKKKPKKVPREA